MPKAILIYGGELNHNFMGFIMQMIDFEIIR